MNAVHLFQDSYVSVMQSVLEVSFIHIWYPFHDICVGNRDYNAKSYYEDREEIKKMLCISLYGDTEGALCVNMYIILSAYRLRSQELSLNITFDGCHPSNVTFGSCITVFWSIFVKFVTSEIKWDWSWQHQFKCYKESCKRDLISFEPHC